MLSSVSADQAIWTWQARPFCDILTCCRGMIPAVLCTTPAWASYRRFVRSTRCAC